MSDTTRNLDRTSKGFLDAAHGITECWMMNLVECRVEVRRDSRPDATASGAEYITRGILQPGDAIARLARPDPTIAVAALLA
jgi:hypothetical protein